MINLALGNLGNQLEEQPKIQAEGGADGIKTKRDKVLAI